MAYFKSTNEKDPNDTNSHSEQLIEIKKRNEKLLEAEKKKAKQTKAKFTQDLKDNENKIIILQNEIQQLYIQLIEESKKLNIAYNNYNDLVSILEDKKTELRSLRLAKPQRAKLSSVQERKFEEYKAEYTKTEEIIRSCNDEIVKVRKRFDLQNLKLDYEKRYTSQLREISLLVLSYKNDSRQLLPRSIICSKMNKWHLVKALKMKYIPRSNLLIPWKNMNKLYLILYR